MKEESQSMILILGEIKGTVTEVKEAIRELKETVANNNKSNNGKIESLEAKHDARLSDLESFKERVVGAVAAWSLGAGAFFASIFHFIPKIFWVH